MGSPHEGKPLFPEFDNPPPSKKPETRIPDFPIVTEEMKCDEEGEKPAPVTKTAVTVNSSTTNKPDTDDDKDGATTKKEVTTSKSPMERSSNSSNLINEAPSLCDFFHISYTIFVCIFIMGVSVTVILVAIGTVHIAYLEEGFMRTDDQSA